MIQNGTLCIAAPSFGESSETFVSAHVRALMPGRTVLVTGSAEGTETYGLPILLLDALSRRVDGRRQSIFRRMLRRFGRFLPAREEAQLEAFLRTQKVGAVLAEFGPIGLMLQRACAKCGIPLHVYFRGVDATAHLRNPALCSHYRRMFRNVAGIFAVSMHLRDNLVRIGCPPGLIQVNPSGADPARFSPGTPSPGRILALGRLVEKKAPHLTIEAFARVARQFPEARLDLIGEGPLRSACESVIARHALQDQIRLHGALDHEAIVPLMAGAAIFVQHSITAANGDAEGLPTAIVEAMCAALPVVATRHSGIPEAVEDGKTGFLVDEGDVAGMSQALAVLLADPMRGQAMGRAGRERALTRFTQAASHATIRRVMGLLPEPDTAVQERARIGA